MSNERPNASGESKSVHTAKNEIPTQEMILIVNRAFSAWQLIIKVGQEKWPAVCDWFAQELPEVQEFWKLKPHPS
jgi:hypothetical protein